MQFGPFLRRLSLHWPGSRNASVVYISLALIAAAFAISSYPRKPRAWPVGEVPIAFWAWRNQTPAGTDVRQAIDQTKANTIFLRAGQIDLQDGTLRRIRPVVGLMPKDVDLHLVYNATRGLLAQLEQVDENALAEAISAAYRTDTARAVQDHARVVGLQIDIDMPTRLLGRYARTLRALRAGLKPGLQLSITGLPTWMNSTELSATLAQVDFWIPQLYGAEIPERFDRSIPISSLQTVSAFVGQARSFDKPFLAGLAAYSWTLLYNSNGSLISLRGDMDPRVIADDQNLELIEQRPFETSPTAGAPTASEWRQVYRARTDGVVDDLVMHAGDVLVVDVPTAESLRQSARAVRELAGEKLLGICVFRLPAPDDAATLNIQQVASALADVDSSARVEVRILADAQSPNWIIEARNTGTANATVGTVKIELETAPGTFTDFTPRGSDLVESLCTPAGAPNLVGLEPCSLRRAGVWRFKPRTLLAGQTVTARLTMNLTNSRVIPVSVEMQTDTGQIYQDRFEVIAESRVKR
ncbi:MAG: hypothetical protein QOK48_898 [Blastocatellia bacterium]|jgi:hypothetical protein|nr:hypothetical protein [Blastocatellia bacterium]